MLRFLLNIFLIFLPVVALSNALVLSKENTEHFVWGEVSDGWWYKDTGCFTIISERMPPNSTEKKHYHSETEQFLYVLDGVLSVEINDAIYVLNQGEGIDIPAKVPHNMWNDSNSDVSLLVISGPNLKTDRINL